MKVSTACKRVFDEKEMEALYELSDSTGLSLQRVLKQALRVYQLSLSDVKLPNKLVEDNERLREGDFTPEEFQNLCHCIPENNQDAFFTGCAEYQKKLFGVSERENYNKALKDLFSLFTKGHNDVWCFNSLQRDGAKFDEAMNILYNLVDKS